MLKNYASLFIQDRHGNIELKYPNDIFSFYCLVSIFVTTTLIILASVAFTGYNVQLVIIHFDIVIFLIITMFIVSLMRSWLALSISVAEQISNIEVAVAKHIRLPEKRRPRIREHDSDINERRNMTNAYSKNTQKKSYSHIHQSVNNLKKNDPPNEQNTTNNHDDNMVTIEIDDKKLNNLFNRGNAFH